jgi:hypothetical protein
MVTFRGICTWRTIIFLSALFAFSLLWLIASTCFKHSFAHHQEALYVPIVVYTVPPDDEQIGARNMWRLLNHHKLKANSASCWFYYTDIWPASWSSCRSFWLLIMRSRVRFQVLPWGFFIEGQDSHGDHGLGSLVELRFKVPPGTWYSYITIHLIGTV